MEQVAARYDDQQLQAITDFVARVTDALEEEAVTLRTQSPRRQYSGAHCCGQRHVLRDDVSPFQ